MTPGGLLPIPHINKRRGRKKLEPPNREPRRSRRIAGIPADYDEVCPPHLKKRVMRALDMIVGDEREQISQEALADYIQHFKHPLSASHTKALAALFGWDIPEPGAELAEF